MKKLIIFLVLGATVVACDQSELFIQPDEDVSVAVLETSEASSIDEVFMVVEEQPSYPGGHSAWVKHLSTTLKYPEQAKNQGIEGAVFVSFVVDKTGELKDGQVIRGIGGGCDEEALRVVMESDKWNPGKQRGREVNSRMQMRVVFKLAEGVSSPQSINREIIEIPDNSTASAEITSY